MWGRGQILEREGSGEKIKLSIRFSDATKLVMAAPAVAAGMRPAPP